MYTSSNLWIMAIAAILFTSPAGAYDQPATERNLDREIGLCVARIGDRANYNDAVRVVHRVVKAEQVNLAEQQFNIDTIVLAGDENAVIRAYSSTCVTMGPVRVVRFRIDETAGPSYSAGL